MEAYQIRRLNLRDNKENILGICLNYGKALVKAIEYRDAPKEKGVYYNFFVDKIEVIE